MYFLSWNLFLFNLAASCIAEPLFRRDDISVDGQASPAEPSHLAIPSSMTSAGPPYPTAPSNTSPIVPSAPATPSTTSPAAPNVPSDTDPFQAADVVITTYSSPGCVTNATNITSFNVYNGHNYHTEPIVYQSYNLSRPLGSNEQLDFSYWGDPGNPSPSAVDPECAQYKYSVYSNTTSAGTSCSDITMPAVVSFAFV